MTSHIKSNESTHTLASVEGSAMAEVSRNPAVKSKSFNMNVQCVGAVKASFVEVER